jgi:hypothetical protein
MLPWRTLVRDYRDKYGAHQSPLVYRYLFESRVYLAVGLPVVSFMLRRLGVAVSSACHQLLAGLVTDHEPRQHSTGFNGVDLGLATLRGDDDLLCLMRTLRDDVADVEVIAVPISGGREVVWYIPPSGPPPVAIVRPRR